MKKTIAILLMISILLQFTFFIHAEDLPLATQIDNLVQQNKVLQSEKNTLTNTFIQFTADRFRLSENILKLKNQAKGNVIVLTVRLALESVGLIATTWKDVVQKTVEEITGMDDIYNIQTTEQYAKDFSGILKLIAKLESMITTADEEMNKINARTAEIDKTIASNKAEIERLKGQYKQVMGEDYVSGTSNRNINKSTLSSRYDNISEPTNNGTTYYSTGWAAANAGYQSSLLNLQNGDVLTSPELKWTNNTGDVLVYDAILNYPAWDGTYEGAKDTPGCERILYTVFKDKEGRFFLYSIAPNQPYNTPPEVEVVFNNCYLARGFTVKLHADIEDADNDSVDITWFLHYYSSEKGDNENVKIGQGNDFLWTIPNDCHIGYIAYVAVDSKGGMTYFRTNYDLSEDYGIRDIDFSVSPPIPDAGQYITVIADIRTQLPGSVEVDWSYTPTSNYEQQLQYVTTQAEFVYWKDADDYVYRSVLVFPAEAYDENMALIYSYDVRAKVKTGVAGIVHDTSYEYSHIVYLSDVHIKKNEQDAMKMKVEAINDLKNEYTQLYNDYLVQYAFLLDLRYDYVTRNLYNVKVRSKEYVDWLLGLTQADTAWGQNFTFSLFQEDSEQCLKALKWMLQKLSLSNGTDIDVALSAPTEGSTWNEKLYARLKVIYTYANQTKALFAKNDALAEAYQKAYALRDKIYDLCRGMDVAQLGFDPDALLWPAEAVYPTSEVARAELKSDIASFENDIQRFPVDKLKLDKGEKYLSYAQKLQTIGVFKGTGNGFSLDKVATRAEGAVMLVRLLGLEKEALASLYAHPFNDVPAWASPYVGCLYHYSFTKGSGTGRYGSSDTINAQQYYTFVLRALGYNDATGDFTWNESLEKAREIGMLQDDFYWELKSSKFMRDHLAKTSYVALKQKIKGEERTLAQKLVEEGVLTQEDALEIGV